MTANPLHWPASVEWMKLRAEELPTEWPLELPPEDQSETENFWREACRYEMSTRDSLSAKIQMLLDGSERPTISPLEGWLFRRRMDFAVQLILAKASKGIAPPDDVRLRDVIDWALVQSWEQDGCIAMWHHSERGGVPHPDNPDGLSPMTQE